MKKVDRQSTIIVRDAFRCMDYSICSIILACPLIWKVSQKRSLNSIILSGNVTFRISIRAISLEKACQNVIF